MVHFGYANAADSAMVCPLWLPILTNLAELVLIGRWCLGYHFWSLESCHCIRQKCHKNEPIKEDLDKFAVHFVSHPFVNFVVHQVNWHCIEDNHNETHGENEDTAHHIIPKNPAKQAMA